MGLLNVKLVFQLQPDLKVLEQQSLYLCDIYFFVSQCGLDYAKDDPLKILHPGLYGLTDLRDIIPFLRFSLQRFLTANDRMMSMITILSLFC